MPGLGAAEPVLKTVLHSPPHDEAIPAAKDDLIDDVATALAVHHEQPTERHPGDAIDAEACARLNVNIVFYML